MTDEVLERAPEPVAFRWRMVVQSLTQPYRVTLSMVLLVSLVPFYLFIADWMPSRPRHIPALWLDRLVPVEPAWALVYGSFYLFLIALPVLVVRQDEHVRRTVYAYLLVWITAYAVFLLYPTTVSRPAKVIGEGFAAWGLRSLYAADPPFNCFPSLHVAHSFVSALTCLRVHRGVGIAATICASVVGLSTLYTHQHSILDVIAGVLLALVAYALFLRNLRAGLPELDRQVAPLLALGIAGMIAAGVAGLWAAYRWFGL